MRKVSAIILAILLAISAGACGENNGVRASEAATTLTESQDGAAAAAETEADSPDSVDSPDSATADTSEKQITEPEAGAAAEPEAGATSESDAGSGNGDAAEPQTASPANAGQDQEARPTIAGTEIPITDIGPLLIGQTENKTAATGCTVLICKEEREPDWMSAGEGLHLARASCSIR